MEILMISGRSNAQQWVDLERSTPSRTLFDSDPDRSRHARHVYLLITHVTPEVWDDGKYAIRLGVSFPET
jgi:hypothetical protein